MRGRQSEEGEVQVGLGLHNRQKDSCAKDKEKPLYVHPVWRREGNGIKSSEGGLPRWFAG